MTEIWRPVVGFEKHYEISDFGNVRSIRNNYGNPRQRPLKPETTHDGYLRCALSKNGVRTKKPVAHMVLEAFVGPRPDGMQACHGPKGQRCNHVSNLRWDTPESNYADRSADGSLSGSRNPNASISEDVARNIKKEASNRTILARDIAKKYGTTVNVVRNIRNGNSWSWI